MNIHAGIFEIHVHVNIRTCRCTNACMCRCTCTSKGVTISASVLPKSLHTVKTYISRPSYIKTYE